MPRAMRFTPSVKRWRICAALAGYMISPMSLLDPENLYGIFDYLYSRVGDSCSIHGEITSPLDYYLDLFGYEQGLMG